MEMVRAVRLPMSTSAPLLPLSPERDNCGNRAAPQTPSHHQHQQRHLDGDGLGQGGGDDEGDEENKPFGQELPSKTQIAMLSDPSKASEPDFSTPPLSTFRSHSHSQSLSHSHSRNGSTGDVQGIVARFNKLDIRDSRREELATRRAEMARDLAEEETRRVREDARRNRDELEAVLAKAREEGRKLKKEVEDGRERERRHVKRLDVIMVRAYVYAVLYSKD